MCSITFPGVPPPEKLIPPATLVSSTEKPKIPNSDPLPSPIVKINENHLTLEAAIMELSNWVEHRGSADVADNVRGALWTIDRNQEFIKMTLAVLMAPE
ncbi:hypothetical protein SAMN04490189_5656 [Pseudomonas koreensis]|nr:hypothetical protein GCM10009103_30970 [Pseudomonas koreensis]SDE51925.1 hypothetical protein SAMN04490189_5656 [Pseudomonas koreensis]